MPDLNIAGDAKLTELQGRIKEELSMFSAADLRDSDKARELTAKAALEIANAMEEEQPMLRAIIEALHLALSGWIDHEAYPPKSYRLARIVVTAAARKMANKYAIGRPLGAEEEATVSNLSRF